uniref:VWFA domain-containing protein n=1 Tax=Macrostomum lignano TaxID=282301 RepID=A0A1I8GY95_9PLAT
LTCGRIDGKQLVLISANDLVLTGWRHGSNGEAPGGGRRVQNAPARRRLSWLNNLPRRRPGLATGRAELQQQHRLRVQRSRGTGVAGPDSERTSNQSGLSGSRVHGDVVVLLNAVADSAVAWRAVIVCCTKGSQQGADGQTSGHAQTIVGLLKYRTLIVAVENFNGGHRVHWAAVDGFHDDRHKRLALFIERLGQLDLPGVRIQTKSVRLAQDCVADRPFSPVSLSNAVTFTIEVPTGADSETEAVYRLLWKVGANRFTGRILIVAVVLPVRPPPSVANCRFSSEAHWDLLTVVYSYYSNLNSFTSCFPIESLAVNSFPVVSSRVANFDSNDRLSKHGILGQTARREVQKCYLRRPVIDVSNANDDIGGAIVDTVCCYNYNRVKLPQLRQRKYWLFIVDVIDVDSDAGNGGQAPLVKSRQLQLVQCRRFRSLEHKDNIKPSWPTRLCLQLDAKSVVIIARRHLDSINGVLRRIQVLYVLPESRLNLFDSILNELKGATQSSDFTLPTSRSGWDPFSSTWNVTPAADDFRWTLNSSRLSSRTAACITAQVLANFDDVTSLSDFNSAVDRLTMSSERAEISKGIKLARESVLNKARAAPTPRLLALVKDGQCAERITGSSDAELASIESEVAAARSMESAVHAVGIGGLWNSKELKAIFGTNYLLFKNTNKAMESVKSLNKKLCPPSTCKNSGGRSRGSFQSCKEKKSCSKMERSLGACKADGNLLISETLQFFDRKKQSCVTHTEKHKVDCSRAIECENQVGDVMIMLDQSSTVRSKYRTITNSARELIKSMNIGPKNVHLGVTYFNGLQFAPGVFYSESLKVKVAIGEEFNKQAILKIVDEMANTTDFGHTYTGDALVKVGAILESKGRRNVNKAIIVITDGSSDDPKVLFNAVSVLKSRGVTIYAIGVKPLSEGAILNLEELKMMTAPESDKNLFLLEKFDQLKDWAKKFSLQLCMELKPLSPELCSADVQFKSVSSCFKSKMQVTFISFKYDETRKCIKHFKNRILKKCKATCVDPIDGSDHLEGEFWTNMCHEFRCDRSGNTILPTTAKKCVAADFSCKPIGAAPFRCRNIDGEERENCQCIDKDGEAMLVVDNPN